MLKTMILLLIILVACREMHNEEFLADQVTGTTTTTGGTGATTTTTTGTGGTATNVQDVTYNADLTSTDPNVTSLSGNARIDVRGGNVNVDLQVDGIPQNIIQIHYSYINGACPAVAISIPNDQSSTRTFNIAETTSADALAQDLASFGASTGAGDVNLNGKSLQVKAFSSLSGIPNPNGTNAITILCGPILSTDAGATTTTTGTFGTTTTGTFGTTTTGTFGTTTTGTFGTTTF